MRHAHAAATADFSPLLDALSVVRGYALAVFFVILVGGVILL